VRIALPAKTPLLIGMTTEVNIVTARREHALLVPTTALNGNTIWLLRDSHAHQQTLTLGARGAARTEVKAGLSDNDWILTEPPAGLKNGQAVRAETPMEEPAR
jgi:multidrug efflux pump subunit AcrA (membrane-fusion protein)